MLGPIDLFDEHMGSNGTRLAYKLIGTVVVIIGFFEMTNLWSVLTPRSVRLFRVSICCFCGRMWGGWGGYRSPILSREGFSVVDRIGGAMGESILFFKRRKLHLKSAFFTRAALA
jgi:hypothetical protein